MRDRLVPLVDSHAHPEEVEDLAGALERARQRGVARVVAVGSDLPSSRAALELARGHPGIVFPALGLHPWRMGDGGVEETLEFIRQHLFQAIALGEVGLDYDKRVLRVASKEAQRRVFRRLLEFATSEHKPVLVHSRYAWGDALELVREAGVKRAVFHWFTGPSGILDRLVEAGYHLSATPACAYHPEHRRAVKEAPLDRLLLETDTPVVYRDSGRASEPGDVLRVAELVAGIKGLTLEQIAQVTTENALALFGEAMG